MSTRTARPSKKHTYSSTSSDSDISTSSSSTRISMDAVHPVAYVEVLRCMRCAKSTELTSTDDAATNGMIQVGTGIYYCSREGHFFGSRMGPSAIHRHDGHISTPPQSISGIIAPTATDGGKHLKHDQGYILMMPINGPELATSLSPIRYSPIRPSRARMASWQSDYR
ncbi:hypothetical protein M0657_002375 [Pyricularia oryzae]|uniref:Uncharacterized protein n=2 Tax=Pyricularia oryzae TaxID=318829 RepID=A0AA97NYG0_PYRO3|nr:hypothetical protein OOU_Y34scaffold00534g65 [Pyricularia oryzae Y34]KAI6315176.1 hypothetical protein MCOR34_004755 [Pyricularia oryzae]KAI6424884.1 hypothetical protein MCOR24_003241 [Pyricularia oryzae]KAI6432482.1 hypothetical protein MCOR21_003363 [Pyricularia oryzae]KAI6557974.1 hypothetical protein MCOR03_005535 [Pyricularia oryzae]